jgi:hypothetical protein
MTMHEQIPEDIRGLASRLERLGEQERLAAEDACARVCMRTTRLLTDPQARPERAGGVVGRLWLWLAAPAVVAAGVLVAVGVMSPGVATVPVESGVDVLAAGIESDIDAWLELDSMWHEDSFESTLAAISIDAAGIVTQPDSFDSLPLLEDDL